jgi:hypothetical protein
MSLLQAPAETPRQDSAPVAGHQCPECLTRFRKAHPGQLFCTPAHRDAWNNRATVRGRVLTPLAIVERVTRGGTRGDKATGCKARQQKDALIQRWIEEDRAAGRMTWPEYMARRYAVGFDPLA